LDNYQESYIYTHVTAWFIKVWFCNGRSKPVGWRWWKIKLNFTEVHFVGLNYTGLFIMFSVITKICNKKTKGPTLMELFTATGKLKKFFDN